MRGVVAWAERHQVALYLAAIVIGVAAGLACPGVAPVELDPFVEAFVVLIVLPLAGAALVQALVELVGMVVFIRLVPALTRARTSES